jgi:hypothetical protein
LTPAGDRGSRPSPRKETSKLYSDNNNLLENSQKNCHRVYLDSVTFFWMTSFLRRILIQSGTIEEENPEGGL